MNRQAVIEALAETLVLIEEGALQATGRERAFIAGSLDALQKVLDVDD